MAVILDQWQDGQFTGITFGTPTSHKIAQSFRPTIDAPIAEVHLQLITNTGGPIPPKTDQVKVDIYTDLNDAPGTLIVSSINLVNGSELTDYNLDSSQASVEARRKVFYFQHNENLIADVTYWMVVSRTMPEPFTDDTDLYGLIANTSGYSENTIYNDQQDYPRGHFRYFDGANWILPVGEDLVEYDTTDFWFREYYQHSLRKNFIYRVFTNLGAYITTWTKEIISEPTFQMVINGGAGEVQIILARDFDSFGEDVDVKLNNRVEVWVSDKEAPSGRLLYCGYISGYKPVIDGVDEHVEITLFTYITEFQRMILRDSSGNTTLTYNSYDPSDILKDVIDKYRAAGGYISYSPTSIAQTNTLVSYTFNTNTIKECLDKIIELCPVGWYWRVDPTNVICLAPYNVFADHSFALGLEVETLETFRRVEDLVNRVLFVGGGSPALFRKYENNGSQASYGLYEKKIVDQRVTVAGTAQTIATREIDSKKDPEIRSSFTIVDSNGPTSKGYDIETIKVGQSLRVRNLRASTQTAILWDVAMWDTDVWDQTLATSAADVIQILSIAYEPDSVKLEASSRLPQIAKRIEDIQRNLEVTQMVENPTAPT